ncbi:MAG: transcription elongation factor GreB [Proteobacteria bacterium]|nr:transcription elongation factor GreB [Pseudomonadota bacterium]
MSKAFKSGDGEGTERDDESRDVPVVPGGKNYMTPAGARRMQQELYELQNKIRPEITQTVAWAAGNGDRSENGDYIYGKKRLREIDKRIRFLAKRLDAVEIVDPLKVPNKLQVFFGATVTIRTEDDVQKTYAIVGVDETDLTKGRISWISPLASALLRAKVGDVVQFQSPKGLQEVEVEAVVYREIE